MRSMDEKYDFDEWESWEEEDLMDYGFYYDSDEGEEDEFVDISLKDELVEEDEEGYGLIPEGIQDQETLEVIQSAFLSRDKWFEGLSGELEVVSGDDLIDFHEFIRNTRGICKWEKNFFKRIKLYHRDN